MDDLLGACWMQALEEGKWEGGTDVKVSNWILASKSLYFEWNKQVANQCHGREFLILIAAESPSSSNSSWFDLAVLQLPSRS